VELWIAASNGAARLMVVMAAVELYVVAVRTVGGESKWIYVFSTLHSLCA